MITKHDMVMDLLFEREVANTWHGLGKEYVCVLLMKTFNQITLCGVMMAKRACILTG